MIPIDERARRYIQKMPPGVSGCNRHSATFHAAFVLLHGFALPEDVAFQILEEFNARCDPPSDLHKLRHRFARAKAASDVDARERGWCTRGAVFVPNKNYRGRGAFREPEAPKKIEFNYGLLERFAGDWAGRINLLWLASRSFVDPCQVTPAQFLSMLYDARREKVLVFTNEYSQGEAMWPADEIPNESPTGIRFLAQPVDGNYYPNLRSRDKKTGEPMMSRRSEESVSAWRYFVIESDQAKELRKAGKIAEARKVLILWLAAITQMPLRIAAIYTSGHLSVHALVRVDAPTKSEWDKEKMSMKQALVQLGADPGSMSAVRLTRLPGCYRANKLQKLLYIQPDPQLRALIEMGPRRDVLKPWLDWARAGVSDGDETNGAALTRALSYYAPVSAECGEALRQLERARVAA